MNNTCRSLWSSTATLFCVAGLLTACAFPPQGPRVSSMPTPGKPLELFAQEDLYCRGYAEQRLGPDSLAASEVDSATSTRHDNNSGFGAAIGANSSASEGLSLQQQYDNAYEQCMVSKNNMPAHNRPIYGVNQDMTYVVPATPAPAAPPPPGYYPLPPPG